MRRARTGRFPIDRTALTLLAIRQEFIQRNEFDGSTSSSRTSMAAHHWRLHLRPCQRPLLTFADGCSGLFLLTFILQPYLIPSESMEHTLLVAFFAGE